MAKKLDDEIWGFVAMGTVIPCQIEKPADTPKLPAETCGYDETELGFVGILTEESLNN